MVSIIMPIYNAQRYLRESLDSIVPQLDSRTELILVNDGSKDDSLKICEEYAAKEKQIRVIDKENGGVSEARNVGIAAATGRYVLFVDADDMLKSDALADIMRVLEEKAYPDMLIWGFSSIGDGRVFNDMHTLEKHPEGFDSRSFLSHLISIDKDERIIGVIWRCAFKRALLDAHKIHFLTSLRMSEDYKFMMDVALAAERVETLGKSLYIYRTNSESVTERYKSNVHPDMSWINDWIRMNVCPRFPEIEEGLDCCCAETYIVTMQNLCKANSPYPFWKRVQMLGQIRREYDYSRCVRVASQQHRRLSAKRGFVYFLLRAHMDAIYLFLYSIKRKTLFSKPES